MRLSPGRRPLAPGTPVPTVLALVGYYPPAYLAGGPTRSVPRIVEQLGDEFSFRIITRDRDLGVAARLPGVTPDRWVGTGRARCLYLSGRRRLMGGVVDAIRRTRHDVLYLNSMFTGEFALVALLFRRFGLVPRRGLVMAPRGELDDSALAIKRRRKRLYLWLVRRLGLLDDATWHAAHEGEAAAIARHFGTQARVLIAADIPMRPEPVATPPPKAAGSLELVFLSRISRIKNLDFAISALATVRSPVAFHVHGPIEDPGYWAECQRLARGLPPNVTMAYRGIVEPHRVVEVLGRHHLLFLPTRGESFGHAIVEALAAGCPVLISDQTPWHDLEPRHAGWDLPLAGTDRFEAVIERCAAMDQHEFDTWWAGARRLGRQIADDPARDAAYREVFRTAMAAQGAPPHGHRR